MYAPKLLYLGSSLQSVLTKADSKESLIVKYIQVVCIDALRWSSV